MVLSPAQGEPAPAALDADGFRRRLDRMERRLADCRIDPTCDADEAAELLAELEAEALALPLPSGAEDDSDLQAPRLLADLHAWRKLCERFGDAPTVAAIRETVHAWLAGRVAAWERHIESTAADFTPQELFAALAHTTTLQLDALRQSPGDPAGQDCLVRCRQRLRAAMEAAARAPDRVDDALRERWVVALRDRGAQVLTNLEDLPPGVAAAQLDVVADDLAWHVRWVETGRARRRRIRRRCRRLTAERQERDLRRRLEAEFGPRKIAWLERLVLALIVFVLALMIVESTLELSPQSLFWLDVADAAACGVFLSEIGLRLFYVRGKLRWLWRHFLIDVIPSLPLGLVLRALTVLGTVSAGAAQAWVGLLRLPRLIRYLQVLRPVMRALRGFGLLARGIDRLARQYGSVLNRNIIIHPTIDELERIEASLTGPAAQRDRIRRDIRRAWRRLLTLAGDDARPWIAGRRLDVLRASLLSSVDRLPGRLSPLAEAPRDVSAEGLLHQLQSATPHDLEGALGDELLAQLARAVRLFARPPLRWLPLISSCVPSITEDMSNAEVSAAGSRRVATFLRRYYDAWLWISDLHGTVSPSLFIDRLGTVLVNSSFRPAYRLVLFGGVFVLIDLILRLTALSALHPVKRFLDRYVGPTVLMIGGVCFVILGIGSWLRRLAREATEFYERAAHAQFLELTEMIRTRHIARDAGILHDRVLAAEWRLHDRLADGCPAATVPGLRANDHDDDGRPRAPESESPDDGRLALFIDRVRDLLVDDPARSGDGVPDSLDRVTLLYRDSLDGAPFVDNDTKTTSQLLGNPAIRQLATLSSRFDRREVKALQRLDLVRQKSLFGGPYVWFNLLSRAVAHSVARLVVEYSQRAVPLVEVPLLSEYRRTRYLAWVAAEHEAPPAPDVVDETTYVTTAFTALHFLDCDPGRDADVERRFGPDVRRRLELDRSRMIRRVFGGLPMHHRPREERVLNLYGFYEQWLSGGKALLLPLFVLGRALRLGARLGAWIVRCVREIRHPEKRTRGDSAAEADFRTAVRKINRIRGPIVVASLRMRCKIDPEYLGAPIPGDAPIIGPAPIDDDLRFLLPRPELQIEVESDRARAGADMRRLAALIDAGLLERLAAERQLPPGSMETAAHRRAAAVAYLGDYRRVRTLLSATDVLDEVFRFAATQPRLASDRKPHPLQKRRFARYWKLHGFGTERCRSSAWRAVEHNLWGVADALAAWARHGDYARFEGERRLGELLLHPGRINEQLLTLRTIQSLALIDVLNYRKHVFLLGRYAERGESPTDLLNWPPSSSARRHAGSSSSRT